MAIFIKMRSPPYRDIITEVICKEEEKQELVPSSDTHTPHETSNTDEPGKPQFYWSCLYTLTIEALLKYICFIQMNRK